MEPETSPLKEHLLYTLYIGFRIHTRVFLSRRMDYIRLSYTTNRNAVLLSRDKHVGKFYVCRMYITAILSEKIDCTSWANAMKLPSTNAVPLP
jgi:hypothetical protein